MTSDVLSQAPRNGMLEGMDPRVRILAAFGFAILVVSLNDLKIITLALVVAFLHMIAARLPVVSTLKKIAAMDSFIIFLIVILPFTTTGETAFTIFGFAASVEGIHLAAEIILTANAAMMMTLALISTMEANTFGQALARLKVPVMLVQLLFFMVRYIEVLNQERLRMRQAMRTRGFVPRNTLHTYRSFGFMVGMMLIRSLERSERIMKAMKCRGFDGRLHMIDDMRMGRVDMQYAGIVSVLMVGLVFAEVGHVLPV